MHSALFLDLQSSFIGSHVGESDAPGGRSSVVFSALRDGVSALQDAEAMIARAPRPRLPEMKGGRPGWSWRASGCHREYWLAGTEVHLVGCLVVERLMKASAVIKLEILRETLLRFASVPTGMQKYLLVLDPPPHT